MLIFILFETQTHTSLEIFFLNTFKYHNIKKKFNHIFFFRFFFFSKRCLKK